MGHVGSQPVQGVWGRVQAREEFPEWSVREIYTSTRLNDSPGTITISAQRLSMARLFE